MQKIKHCPFCGCTSAELVGKYLVWVKCPQCGARNEVSVSKKEAIETWNKRFDELEAIEK